MSSVLQQTLRGLCFDTGWCYSVFWKLKQHARTVLTWEDAYYGPKMEDVNANPLATTTLPGFGQQMCGRLTEMEDPIGVSIAKMSYHVYSVGEGIIGRVTFTNKHQWVFSPTDKGTTTTTEGVPNRKTNPRVLPVKYPSGWENQFAAGIKTIAVIAVPQGVVQLGSTRMIAEDLKLVGHVKALFGTLQNVPGAFLSDLVTEVQRGTVHTVYPLAVPAPQLPPRDPVLIKTASPTLARIPNLAKTPSLPANMGLATTDVAAFNSNLGCSGAGRLPMLLPSQQRLTHAHSMPSPSVLGFQGSVPHFQHSILDRPGLESLPRPSFSSIKPSCTWAGPIDMGPTAKVGAFGIVKPPFIASPSSTGSLKRKRTGIISQLPLGCKMSSTAMPVSTVSLSPKAGHPPFSATDFEMQQSPELMNTCSFTGCKGIGLPAIEVSKFLDAHIRSRPVRRMESPGLIEGHSLVAAELSDINSSVGSPKVVITTAKENPSCVVGRPLVEDTQSMGCGASIESRQLVGAGPSDQSPQVVLRRLSTESRHLGSRHPAKCQKVDSSRPLTKRKQLNTSRSSVAVRHVDRSSAETESGQLASTVLDNWLARESPPLVPLPVESLKLAVSRPLKDGGQLWDNSFFVQGRQLGGAITAKGNFPPVSERSSVASAQPCDSKHPMSSISDVFGGHSIHLERGTMFTMKQDLGAREFPSDALPLPCDMSSQTFDCEGSAQMSDLLQLEKHFENADSDHAKELSSGIVDIHESISSSVLCDDYFENLQSSMPVFQNSELCAEDFGPTDSLTQNLFTSEVDDFDDFFAWLTKTEDRSDSFSQPDVFYGSIKKDEVLATHTTQDCGVITKWKAQYTRQTGGSSAAFAQSVTGQAEPESIFHSLASDQTLPNWSANEVANTQSEPQVDMFVNSRIHPQVSVSCSRPTDCGTKVGPSASKQHEVMKRGKKRSHPGDDERVRSKDRQQIQDGIRELRAVVPDGAGCSIDTLLGKTVEYVKVLQRLSQDFGESTESTKIHDGGSEIGIGSEVTYSDASWVMDLSAQGRACPILVENLNQSRQMLVEMLCEEHGVFLQVADTLKSLGLNILKGVMEARNDKVWARFVIEGPEDVHRVEVLWSLMQLLGLNTTR